MGNFAKTVRIHLTSARDRGTQWEPAAAFDGGRAYLPAADGVLRVDVNVPETTAEMVGWTPQARVEGCQYSFLGRDMTSFSGGRAYVYNGIIGRLHLLSDGELGPPLRGTESCESVAFLDAERLVCASSHPATDGDSFAVDILSTTTKEVEASFHSISEAPAPKPRTLVAVDRDRIFVGARESQFISVYDESGRRSLRLDLAGSDFRKAPATAPDGLTAWFRSFTPVVSLAAGGGFVGATYRLDAARKHTVVFDVESGMRVLDVTLDRKATLVSLVEGGAWFSDLHTYLSFQPLAPGSERSCLPSAE